MSLADKVPAISENALASADRLHTYSLFLAFLHDNRRERAEPYLEYTLAIRLENAELKTAKL